MPNTTHTAKPNPPFPEVGKFARKARLYRQKYAFYFEEVQKQETSYITVADENKLNFCTYSYLGLINHPDIINGAMKALIKYGCGTHGVRLLGGNLSIYRELERAIAGFCQREEAMLLTSGFLTNQTVIRTLVRPGDVIYCEARNHASIMDGCKLANAEIKTFHHKDVSQLKCMLQAELTQRRKLIVADAVFSMDGDILDLPQYLQLRNQFANTYLMVDEAHSIGVLGTHGKGIEEHFNIPPAQGIDIKMGTLSKAIPGNGGFIAAKRELIDYLRYHVRGYIFTATLSPITAGAALATFGVLEREAKQRIEKLWDNVHHLRRRLRENDIATTNSCSPITGVLIGNEALAFSVAQACFDQGLFVMPVAYPAVARGAERIRLNVHCNHTFAQIDQAVKILANTVHNALGQRKAS